MAAKYCYRRITTLPNATKSVSQNVPIRGIIFDMDGTLTLPILDFKGLRAKLGIDDSTDILEFASSRPPDVKEKVYTMIEEWEADGNANMKLRPYLHELFYFLKEEGLNVALLTRNNRAAVDTFVASFLAGDTKDLFKNENDMFSVILTRDFTPVKPHPAPAQHICRKWNVPEESVVFVGDDLQDIQCGLNAGTVTTLVNKAGNEAVKEISDFNINSLSELIDIYKANFIIDRTSKK